MRQVFFLIVAAMFIAFSLSWASAGTGDGYFVLPENVLLPIYASVRERPEISISVPLNKSCELIEGVQQELRGHKLIFSVRAQQSKNHLCIQDESRSFENMNLKIERFKTDSSGRIDIYFREDEESLKYFGSIEMKEKHEKVASFD